MRRLQIADWRSPIGVTAILVVTLGLSVVGMPQTAEAQQPAKIPRIGVIEDHSAANPFLPVFRQALRELGYTEGQSILVEYRYANGVADRFPDLAAELIRLKVDVLVVGGTTAAQAAKTQTSTVPIVFALAGDPVGSGLVASLARPGGNVTGISVFHPELSAKDLELLKATVPQMSRVAVMYNPLNPISRPSLERTREAAQALALKLQVQEVRRPDQLASAFSMLMAWRPGALLALSDPVFGTDLAQLAKLASRNRLPAVYNRTEFAEAGGMLAYGPSFSANYRRAATFVDKILKGSKPGDLPVEQPTKFELVINLKTAKALGITIPQSVLSRADEVLQ